MFQKKPSASEVDGVQYRRAKLWQIICYACNAFVGMSVYSLIGMASYSASIGYGITTATVGLILMLARILDGFTDPMLAFVYDRVNTRFGKLRVLLISGYLIEAVGLLCMFNLCSSKGFGLPVFALTYIIYIIGYTVTNMTAQTLPAIMTNDPRQRPTIGVWSTALNYAVPMGMSMLIYTVILPKCGGTFNQDFLSTVCTIVLIIAGIGTLIVCAGISAYDKPAKLGVTIKNTGNYEVQPGQSMSYHFSGIANTSNVALNSFFWHDRIPTDATRAMSISTGTYNQRLYYKVTFKTNLNDYRTLASNLLTANNYSLSLNAATLGLVQGEYVTDVRFEFGTVPSGFSSVVKPTMRVQVLGTVSNGYQIINRADVGGKYLNEWQTAKSPWITTVRRFQSISLPKTGY